MARIEMSAIVLGPQIAAAGPVGGELASVVLDTAERLLEYSIASDIRPQAQEVQLHGFVPPGWRTDPIQRLEASGIGQWRYEEWQEKNILAGLAYFTVTLPSGQSVRGQIEQREPLAPAFEDYVTLTALAGACQTSVTIAGLGDNIPMEMEPAQVMMARTGASLSSDGRREQTIGCAVRVGGAQIPGLGRIEIGMFQDENPGHIISMQEGTDFPARMTLDVRKRYVTPIGTFYSEREEFAAENIQRFPPFGVRFTPVRPTAELKSEQTGEVVGHINLGWLVPLCYLDTANFPPRAFHIPSEGE